jgi:hypothetical protein
MIAPNGTIGNLEWLSRRSFPQPVQNTGGPLANRQGSRVSTGNVAAGGANPWTSLYPSAVMKLPKRLGLTLLCVYLVLHGLNMTLDFTFQGLPMVLGILAIAAGVLLFLDR